MHFCNQWLFYWFHLMGQVIKLFEETGVFALHNNSPLPPADSGVTIVGWPHRAWKPAHIAHIPCKETKPQRFPHFPLLSGSGALSASGTAGGSAAPSCSVIRTVQHRICFVFFYNVPCPGIVIIHFKGLTSPRHSHPPTSTIFLVMH